MIRQAEGFPPVALGLASTVLGSIGLVLCLLPILGVSIATGGLLVGVGGLSRGLSAGKSELRWALVGSLLCATSVIIGLTIAYTPITHSHMSVSEPAISIPVGRPFVPPPARPAD